MKKLITTILIAAAIGGYFLIGSPVEKSDDMKSVAKKYEESKQIEIAQEATKQVMSQASQQALDSGCKVPDSQSCSTTTSVVMMGNLAITILFVGLAITGILAVIKVIGSVLSNF